MASIQQLEKLYHIQSLCHAEDSLESAVATERVQQAIQRTEQLIRQRAFLREERRRLRISSERLEQRKAALKMMQRSDWVPASLAYMLIVPPTPATTTPSTVSKDTTASSNVPSTSSGEEKGKPMEQPSTNAVKSDQPPMTTTTVQADAKTPAAGAAGTTSSSATQPSTAPVTTTTTASASSTAYSVPVPAVIVSGPVMNIIKETTLRINVSGLMFETPVAILRRDPDCLLAQLCNGLPGGGPGVPPLLPDPEGFYYFDRDWWLFRYLLQFMRDGTLPDDRSLLAQLYREAGFFHMGELQRAIEEEKLLLRAPDKDKKEEKKVGGGSSSSSSGGGESKDGSKGVSGGEADKNKKWWRTLPSWTQAVEDSKKKEEEKKKEGGGAKGSDDWWTGATYKGKTFLPLSTDPEKVVTKAGEKDEQALPKGTWSTPSPSMPYDPYGLSGYGGGGAPYGYAGQGPGLGPGQYGSTLGPYGGGGGGYGYGSSSSSSLPMSSTQQSYVYSVPTPTASYPTQPYPPSYNIYPSAGGVYGGLGAGVSGGGRVQGSSPSLYDPYILRASLSSSQGQGLGPGVGMGRGGGGSESSSQVMGQLDVEQALAATKSRYPERDVLASSWLDAGVSYLQPNNPDHASSMAGGGGGARP